MVSAEFPLVQPDAFSATSFDAGLLPRCSLPIPGALVSEVYDAFGYASGALVYRLHLPPRGGATTAYSFLFPCQAGLPSSKVVAAGVMQRERDAVAAVWRAKLNRISFRVPPAAQPPIDTLRTALAHVLINRDGPALQPGARAYERSGSAMALDLRGTAAIRARGCCG